MIFRSYFKEIEEELKKPLITALVGLRQVGKTTLLNYAYEKVKDEGIFLSLDDVTILNHFENDIEFFIEQYVKNYEYIFIDEIQYSKTSGQKLKYIYDKYKKKIMISGSSLPELSIHSLSYLVGRVTVIQVFPLSFKEFLGYKSPQKLNILSSMRKPNQLELLRIEFEQYLMYGGYPYVVLQESRSEKIKALENIVNSYLLKEIREILNFENSIQFENVLKRLALSDGSILNKSNVSQELGINRVTLYKILDILYLTAILYQVQPFLSNKIKEIVKSSKTYICDLGFKNTLINNFNELDLRQDKGEIYESFVLSSLLSMNFTPQFWNFKNESEVDFVLNRNDVIIGIECKSRLNSNTLTHSMKKFISKYSPRLFIVFNSSLYSSQIIKDTEVIFTPYENIFSLGDRLKEILY